MILLNDFRRQWEDTRADALAAFAAVGESGWYILGEEVRRLEAALAAYWGRRHAIGVASGLDAIEISLCALGCKPGDRVLTTPLSAFATTLAIVKLGAVPVFADTDEFGLVDLGLCRDILRRRPDIRFLLPVHLYGHALDMEELSRLRADFGCVVVEDCAQSIGAKFCGVATGTAGQAAATSFYPTKNLGAMGDGGAILTDDDDLAASVRMLRDYGQSAKYTHDAAGYNSRLDELQAALLRRVYLPRLEQWTARRREIAGRYLAAIRNPAIVVPGPPPGSESCWHLFPVMVPAGGKQEVAAHLRAGGILTGEHYPFLIPEQKGLAGVPFEVIGGLDRARLISESELSLPIHPYMSVEEVERVIDSVTVCETPK